METEVNRPAATAVAVIAKPSAVNVHRLGMLGLNLGLWTLIVMIARALKPGHDDRTRVAHVPPCAARECLAPRPSSAC